MILLLVTTGMFHSVLQLARHFHMCVYVYIYIYIPFTDNVLITNILIHFRSSV